MTKKVKISFIILVWSIVAVQIFVNYRDRLKLQELEKTNQAVTAFSVADDNIDGNLIVGQGYFGDMKITDEIKKEMLVNLAQKLDVSDDYTFYQSKNETVTQLTLTCKTDVSTTNLQIISKGQSEKPEQYIIVEIQTTGNEELVYSIYEKVERVFEEIGLEGQVNMEMTVERNGENWKVEKS